MPLSDDDSQFVQDKFFITTLGIDTFIQTAQLVGTPTADDSFQFLKNRLLKVSQDIELLKMFSRFSRDTEPECIEKQQVKGHFYKIEDSEGGLIGYLMGTVHIIDRFIMDMNEEINQAVAKADHLFLEIKEIDSDRIKKRHEMKIDQVLKNQPEDKLKKALQVYAKIFDFDLTDAMWTAMKEKTPLLDTLKSFIKWYASAVEVARGSYFTNIHSIDEWLHRHFYNAGKPVLGLESLEEADKVVNKLLYDETFTEMLLNPPENIFCEIPDCGMWRRGDIRKLSHNHEGTLDYELNEARSEKFGKTIYEDLMSNQKIKKIGFYACGTAHLYDAKGIIQSLKERNLRIIRIGDLLAPHS